MNFNRKIVLLLLSSILRSMLMESSVLKDVQCHFSLVSAIVDCLVQFLITNGYPSRCACFIPDNIHL